MHISYFLVTRTRALQISAALILVVILFFLWHYLRTDTLVRKYLRRESRRLYFCGYPLSTILEQNVLNNLERYLDDNLSGLHAILMMELLRGNRTARIVWSHSRSAGSKYHYLVEFRFLGRWYALDLDWHENLEINHKQFNHDNDADKKQSCSYAQFWDQPASGQIYFRLRHRDTSFLYCELHYRAAVQYYIGQWNKSDFCLAPGDGSRFLPYWCMNSRAVNQEIFDFFIASRDYRDPPQEMVLRAIRECTYIPTKTSKSTNNS